MWGCFPQCCWSELVQDYFKHCWPNSLWTIHVCIREREVKDILQVQLPTVCCCLGWSWSSLPPLHTLPPATLLIACPAYFPTTYHQPVIYSTCLPSLRSGYLPLATLLTACPAYPQLPTTSHSPNCLLSLPPHFLPPATLLCAQYYRLLPPLVWGVVHGLFSLAYRRRLK